MEHFAIGDCMAAAVRADAHSGVLVVPSVETPPYTPVRGSAHERSILGGSTGTDADGQLQRMLRESHLSELLKYQREMAAEIGTLDSDMQMLVYENYSKFITATDTIRAMSGSMSGMDEQMAHLSTLLGELWVRGLNGNGRRPGRWGQCWRRARSRPSRGVVLTDQCASMVMERWGEGGICRFLCWLPLPSHRCRHLVLGRKRKRPE